MPKGRANRNTQPEHAAIASDLPIIGKIRVGELVTAGGKTYPKSLDYFRATGSYAKLFHDLYDKPQRITIAFHSDDYTKVCSEQTVLLNAAGKRMAWSDGEMARWFDEKNGSFQTIDLAAYGAQTPEAALEKLLASGVYGAKASIKTRLTLRFIILGIDRVGGLWEFSTHAEATSGPDIRSSFDSVLAQLGRVRMLPFDLVVEHVTSRHPTGDRKFPKVSLVFSFSPENLGQLNAFLESNASLRGVVTPDLVSRTGQPLQLAPAPLLQIQPPMAEYHTGEDGQA